MKKVLFLTTLTAFLLTSSAWAADISGKWTLTWWGAGAEESFPLVIKAAGENLTITGTHPTFKEMTGTGTLKGDSISMTLKSSSMEIALTGKVTGNKMAGTREIKASGEGRGGGAPGGAAGGAPQGGQGGAPGSQGGTPGGAAGGPQGGAPGGAAPQGGMPAGAGGAGGGAPQGGQGSDAAGGNENWTAVRN